MDQITDNVWLGNSQDAKNADALRAAGIICILNCAEDLPPALGWRDGFRNYHAGLSDGPGNCPLLYHAARNILYSLMSRKMNTLVHCHEGRSRSAFISAMAMASFYDEGHLSMTPKWVEIIKTKRSIVDIHPAHFSSVQLIP